MFSFPHTLCQDWNKEKRAIFVIMWRNANILLFQTRCDMQWWHYKITQLQLHLEEPGNEVSTFDQFFRFKRITFVFI